MRTRWTSGTSGKRSSNRSRRASPRPRPPAVSAWTEQRSSVTASFSMSAAAPCSRAEGPRQGSEARRESDEAPRTRPRSEAVGYPLPEGRVVPFCRRRGEGERGNDLPSGKAPFQEPKERSKRATERDEFLRGLWRAQIGRIEPGRFVFVDEMGVHTSLGFPVCLRAHRRAGVL